MPVPDNCLHYKDLAVAPGTEFYEILSTPLLRHRAEAYYQAGKQAEIDLIAHYDERDKQ